MAKIAKIKNKAQRNAVKMNATIAKFFHYATNNKQLPLLGDAYTQHSYDNWARRMGYCWKVVSNEKSHRVANKCHAMRCTANSAHCPAVAASMSIRLLLQASMHVRNNVFTATAVREIRTLCRMSVVTNRKIVKQSIPRIHMHTCIQTSMCVYMYVFV